MRKQELIHIHGLLAEVADYCSQDGIAIDMEQYRSMETQPTSIHRSKTDHKEAVFALTGGLAPALAGDQIEPVETDTATAD